MITYLSARVWEVENRAFGDRVGTAGEETFGDEPRAILPAGLAANDGRNLGASAALGSGSSLTNRARLVLVEPWRAGEWNADALAGVEGWVHQSDMLLMVLLPMAGCEVERGV